MVVPIDLLKPILGDLLSSGRPNRPPHAWLGLFATDLEGKVFIVGVYSGAPADRAGLKPGDLVVSVGGEPVSSLADFFRKVWSLGPAGVDGAARRSARGRDGRSAHRLERAREVSQETTDAFVSRAEPRPLRPRRIFLWSLVGEGRRIDRTSLESFGLRRAPRAMPCRRWSSRRSAKTALRLEDRRDERRRPGAHQCRWSARRRLLPRRLFERRGASLRRQPYARGGGGVRLPHGARLAAARDALSHR